MANKILPSVDYLCEILHYDPHTGKLFWRQRGRHHFKSDRACNSWNSNNANKEAFTYTTDQGYKKGNILGVNYKAHRVAWKMFYKEEPPELLDHVNCDRSDNRISNLRAATNVQNTWNQKAYKKKTSRFKGVYYDKQTGLWRSKIRIDGKHKSLGRFATEELAQKAYCEAVKYRGEFARTE